jgi:hypothetical protein
LWGELQAAALPAIAETEPGRYENLLISMQYSFFNFSGNFSPPSSGRRPNRYYYC